MLPAPEIADSIDNDCNGKVDDGATCSAGTQVACYTGPSQSMGIGICHAGTQTCGVDECMGEVTPIAEICNGEDDDCNGVVDDGAFGVGEPCTVVGAKGACASGVKACGIPANGEPKNADGSYCKQVKFPEPEVCDGVDNDCNGVVDDGDPGGGSSCVVSDPAIKGECAKGTSQCVGGQIVCVQTYLPIAETCNAKDDDCNGTIDDGPFCCPDGQKDGNETDIDCGGSCVACAATLHCMQSSDCESHVCKSNVCLPPVCGDDTKNGTESDIDCGGLTCPKCSLGNTCNVGTDCQSGSCVGSTCQ
ncbi:Hypothetical protein A7982_13704 [Minicystis rosea]|nr:Hypothetical protein A7982_13704 [Minicystis rosea]